MTINRFKNALCGYHDKKEDGSNYWNDTTICQEAFAHMFEAQFDEVRYKEIQKYFPNALKKFEELLESIGNDK